MTYFYELQFWCGSEKEFIQATGTCEAVNWQKASEFIDELIFQVVEKLPQLELQFAARVIRPMLTVVPHAKY